MLQEHTANRNTLLANDGTCRKRTTSPSVYNRSLTEEPCSTIGKTTTRASQDLGLYVPELCSTPFRNTSFLSPFHYPWIGTLSLVLCFFSSIKKNHASTACHPLKRLHEMVSENAAMHLPHQSALPRSAHRRWSASPPGVSTRAAPSVGDGIGRSAEWGPGRTAGPAPLPAWRPRGWLSRVQHAGLLERREGDNVGKPDRIIVEFNTGPDNEDVNFHQQRLKGGIVRTGGTC